MFVIRYINNFKRELRRSFFIIISKFVFQLKQLQVEQLQNIEIQIQNIQMSRGQLKNPATSNIQIHILQTGTIVAKSFTSHVTEFLDLSLIKNSAIFAKK